MSSRFALLLNLGLALLYLVASGPAQAQGPQWPDTEWQWITSGSSITRIATGARLTHHHWYGQVTMGGLDACSSRDVGFFAGLDLGRRLPVTDRLHLGADLGWRHVMNGAPSKYFTLDARLKLELVLNKHMSVFVGGALTRVYRGYSLGDDFKNMDSVFWGVGLI